MKPSASPQPNREWIEWVVSELNRNRIRRASCDGRRMAETPKSGSVRSTTSAVPNEDSGDAHV